MQNGYAYGQSSPFAPPMTPGTIGTLGGIKASQSTLAGFESRLDVALKQLGEATSRCASVGDRLLGAEPSAENGGASPDSMSQLERIGQRLNWLDAACNRLSHEVGRLESL